MTTGANTTAGQVALGLGANWQQFSLLVAVNVFVGGMIGLERTILPILAEEEFHVSSKTAVVSFIATVGLAQACSNLLAGTLAQRFTRRKVLIAGWLFGVPIPFMLISQPLVSAHVKDLEAPITSSPLTSPL